MKESFFDPKKPIHVIGFFLAFKTRVWYKSNPITSYLVRITSLRSRDAFSYVCQSHVHRKENTFDNRLYEK